MTIIEKLIFCKHHCNYYSDCNHLNHIPKGLPGELNLMLFLYDTNLKQGYVKIVQNGTMDCMKQIVPKLRDRILYLRREMHREKQIFCHENGHCKGECLLNIINSKMDKLRDELDNRRKRKLKRTKI